MHFRIHNPRGVFVLLLDVRAAKDGVEILSEATSYGLAWWMSGQGGSILHWGYRYRQN